MRQNCGKKVVSVQMHLEQDRYAIDRGVTQSRVCTLMCIARSELVYHRKMSIKNGPVIEAMRDYSAQGPRYGARRARIFLRRAMILCYARVGQQGSGRLRGSQPLNRTGQALEKRNQREL